MGTYCAEYSGKHLRYSLVGDDLVINVADLHVILGIEPGREETADLEAAVHLAESHDLAVAAWLRKTFSLTWLHDQMEAYLTRQHPATLGGGMQ